MATQIAEAYVQIKPTTQGIKSELSSQLNGDLSEAGEEGGSVFGSGLVSKLKSIIVAAGIGTVIKEALDAGGDLQQSYWGGLDTLYGEAADAARAYADEASKMGISMNDYAEQAVSFGAALKSAYGGDVTQAAEAANTAISDMADNSAKMGTSIESIQNAYQGFAKQNYTMLDNLKLGYGGTKTEMERLLADAEELSGVHYDIDNLGDVYSAIHVIQEDLGLTGVAAEEASTTFTGSFNAMKAAATNLLAVLTTGGDVEGALTTLISSVGTFLFNNLVPMLTNIITALPGVVVTLIQQGIPAIQEGLSEMVTNLGESFNLEEFMAKGVELITNFANGILQDAPEAITNMGEVINSIIDYILDNLPTILAKGVELIANLAAGLIQNLPAIVAAIVQVIAKILATIGSHLPEILKEGFLILAQLTAGLINAIPSLIASIPQIISGIVDAFGSYDWGSIGSNILAGIKDGILGGISSIVDAAKEAAQAAFEAAKELLDIHSPSRVFRDQVGAMIPAGIAVGIDTNLGYIEDSMKNLTDSTLKTASVDVGSLNLDTAANGISSGMAYNQTVNITTTSNSPDEIARRIRLESRYGLMVGGALG